MLRPKGPSYHKRETSPWILVISLSTILVIGVLASIRVGEKREYERNIRLHHRKDKTHVAFIGNSMMYYNDLPRLLERFSENRMEQRSCLHGGTTLTKILVNGNGMFNKFNTTNAFVETTRDQNVPMYDFGDCTVPQLLFGFDERLDKQVHDKSGSVWSFVSPVLPVVLVHANYTLWILIFSFSQSRFCTYSRLS